MSFSVPRALVLFSWLAITGCYGSSSVLDGPDGSLDASRDAGTTDASELDPACLSLCESCSLWPCESHCARDCAASATAAGTCDALRACISDPPPPDTGVVMPFDGGTRPGEPPPGVVVCGTEICADTEECCLLDLRCVPLGDASCVPASTTDPDACARQSDCDAGEVCLPDEATTGEGPVGCGGGESHCVLAPDAAWCAGTGPFELCGCDGRTYHSPCEAAAAGVRFSTRVACGTALGSSLNGCSADADCTGVPHAGGCDLSVGGRCVREDPIVACGIDTQCPSGQDCCAFSGTCFDPSRPESCALPPDGTLFPCEDDSDCARFDGSYWGGAPIYYCDGAGCGTGGGCRPPPSTCEGTVVPVCGCDGATYQNECEAQRSRVRIAHDGGC
jgi:hypothetical protein